MELKVARANALCVGEEHVMVGCSKGLVRCFSSRTLNYLTSLPAPESLQPSDVAAMCYHEASAQLTVIFRDHSLAVWSLANLQQSRLVWSQCLHSSCIWSLESYQSSCTTGSSLVTCGEDDTIRLWSLDQGPLLQSRVECHHQNTLQLDTADGERPGVRCVRVSPDGLHLVSGDRAGNIRVHSTRTFTTLCTIEAHDSEVMCLDFGGDKYLASGSRDRLVHLFDVKNNFEFLTTFEEHSSCVTAVRFLAPACSDLKLVSCGADKSIITRSVRPDPKGGVTVTRSRHVVCGTVPYDLAVESSGQVSVACHDRNVRVYSDSTTTNKPRTLKGSDSDDGYLFKIVFDRSGAYFATSCTDKSIAVFDFVSGEMLTTLVGHSEIVTGLAFSHDCKYLISVSGDSCVFVWKLTKKMTSVMLSRLNETSEEESFSGHLPRQEEGGEEFGSPPSDFLHPSEDPSPDSVQVPDFRFSVGKLPIWARNSKEIEEDNPISPAPRGKWSSKGALSDPLQLLDDPLGVEQEEDLQLGAKKKLFPPSSLQEECDCAGPSEEFQVNATDLETLRRSQRRLVLPQPGDWPEEDEAADTTLDLLNEDTLESCCPDEDREEEESHTQVKYLNTLGFSSEDENLVKKPSSISKAWREGTTPVQRKQQQLVSIEKLLATNQLNSVLKGITPAKSPRLVSHHFTDIKTCGAEDEEIKGGVQERLKDSNMSSAKKLPQLSKELISVNIYINIWFLLNSDNNN